MRRRLRRWRSGAMVGVLALSAAVAVLPLLVILGTLVAKGAGSINPDFFIRLPVPPGESGGGVAHAIVGTLLMVGTACLMGLPVGIGAGIFAAEWPGTRLAVATRFIADVLNGTPSIVVGVVAWTWIVATQGHVSGFAGSVALAERFIALGAYFTFGGAVTLTHDYDEAVRRVPPERLMTETDAPFVSPVSIRGRRNEPANVVDIARQIAHLKGMAPEELAEHVWKNSTILRR